MDRAELIQKIEGIDASNFEEVALKVFQYQYLHNDIYHQWVDNLNVNPKVVDAIGKIPHIPISAFKSHTVSSLDTEAQTVFESSGTTGSIPSRHYVYDMPWYLGTTKRIFESFYRPVSEYCFLALLPSYLERQGSSLVAMVDFFIKQSKYPESGFYLDDFNSLRRQLEQCKKAKIPTILFGVSFALLDFIEEENVSFPELIIIETGGMKGRKKEITRDELQSRIANGFGVQKVHSEYGMTELFSQAYSQENGIFFPGNTMAVSIKEITDPLSDVRLAKSGIINIIDLANIDSCAFIETQDIGRLYQDGSFEVLGRLDTSDVRGCNLMVSDI